jgi:hypothetical protein
MRSASPILVITIGGICRRLFDDHVRVGSII